MLKPPVDGSRLWTFMWWVARFLQPLLAKLTLEGLEHVPLDKGFMLVSNHTAAFDTVVNGFTCPRQIHYMGKIELFQINAFVSRVFYALGVFPVDRGNHDLGALEEAARLVHSGRVVGIYPEGTRSRNRKLQKGKTGAARIAMMAGVPVVPVISLGGEGLFLDVLRLKRTDITVRFGPPIYLHGDANKSVDARRETGRCMRAMAELLPPELRGTYSDISVADVEAAE